MSKSILKALKVYLSQFDGMELRPLSEILTDRPEGPASSYAIAPAGSGDTWQDVTGQRHYRNSYVFYALERVDAEADREENWDFLEALTEWLGDQAYEGNYPELPEGYEAESLEVANAMLLDLDEHGYGTYQVQIQLEFFKGGNKNA